MRGNLPGPPTPHTGVPVPLEKQVCGVMHTTPFQCVMIGKSRILGLGLAIEPCTPDATKIRNMISQAVERFIWLKCGAAPSPANPEPRRSGGGVKRPSLSPMGNPWQPGSSSFPTQSPLRFGTFTQLYLQFRWHECSLSLGEDLLSLGVLSLDTDAMVDDELSMFQCGLCKRNFKRLDHLARHVRSRTLSSPFPLVHSLITEDMDC